MEGSNTSEQYDRKTFTLLALATTIWIKARQFDDSFTIKKNLSLTVYFTQHSTKPFQSFSVVSKDGMSSVWIGLVGK